jgi:hypothetical protein
MVIPRDATPKGVRKSAATAAVVLAVFTVWFGYRAISAEITGKVINWERRFGEPVQREISPAKFRKNANLTWFATGFCVLIAVGSFGFYRKLGDYA